jgi:putative flavoprotein involved in K+ transport
LISRFDRHAEKYQLPIAYNSRVTSVLPVDGGDFLVQAQDQEYRARNVVTANGWFNVGKTPPYADKIPPSILQFHTSKYRNPQAIPPGAVLVIGSGQSGAQIAEELYQSGRKVFLATGVAPHLPRRYRGKDIFGWIYDSGFAHQTFEQLRFQGRDFVAPMVSGKEGGHALNLHKFYREGVILLGHARDCVDGKLILAPDLKENLGKADMAQKMVDAPQEDPPAMMDGYAAAEITTLDLQAEGISTIIWACGYSYDSSMFKFPVLNQFGFPDAPTGASSTYPGLYFVGFPFLPTLDSGFFTGIAKNTALVVDGIMGKKVAP